MLWLHKGVDDECLDSEIVCHVNRRVDEMAASAIEKENLSGYYKSLRYYFGMVFMRNRFM